MVSSDADLLVLVDEDDIGIGTLDKASCHDGDGVLHRAFSLFVFNDRAETLLQRRHTNKRLWPGYWSNSCCSHPRPGECIAAAVVRRAAEELGISVSPNYLYKFRYQAHYADRGAERELCSVFVARSTDVPQVNPTEIAEWRWVPAPVLDREMAERPSEFTPWLKMEWPRLRDDFAALL